MAKRLTVDELFHLLRFVADGRFFSVEFERRTDKPDGTAPAGTLRRMLCRTQMHAYKLGVISDATRDEDDFRNAVLTVWSVGDYARMRRGGLPKEQAGFRAWRRVDLVTIRSCSLLSVNELPPEFNPFWHEITNEYRLSHMP